MPQLYTPFMADVGQQLGGAVSDKRNSKLVGSAYMGDPQAMQELMQINPEAGMQIQRRKQQEQQQQLQAEAQQAKALKKSFEDNQGVIDEIAGDVSKFDNFEAAKDYYDRKIQTLPPSPFSEAAKTVELTEKLWQESKVVYGPGGEKSLKQQSFEDSIADFSEEEQELAKRIKVGLSPRAVTTGEITIAQDEKLTEQVAESKSKIAEQKKFAEMTGSSRAKMIDTGYSSIAKIDKNISNIDRAIDELDKGANTGAIESRFFPSLKASTIALENIQEELALDVIGAVTFGALSQGELDLAKRVAMPSGLQPEELKVFLAKKREAQQKLKGYYESQIDFIDDGGTIAGFLRRQRRGQKAEVKSEAKAVTPVAESKSLSDDDLLKMYSE